MSSRLCLIAISLSAIFLSACGGGGGSDSGTSVSSNSRQQTPQPVKFEATVLGHNYCDQTFADPDAVILVHDQQGDVIAQHTPSDAGAVEFDWPQNGRHFTVASYTNNGDLPGVEVRTYLGYTPSDSMEFVFTKHVDNQACNCFDADYNLDDLKAQYPDAQVGVDWYFTHININPNQMPVYCPVEGGASLQLTEQGAQRAIAGSFEPLPGQQNSVLPEYFTSEGIALEVQVENEASFAGNYRYWAYAVGDYVNRWINYFPAIQGDSGLDWWHAGRYVYPALSDNNQFGVSYTNTYSAEGVLFEVISSQQVKVVDPNQVISVNLPEDSPVIGQQLISLLDFLDSDNQASWNYNFDGIDPDFRLLEFEVSSQGEPNSGDNWAWTIYGATSGSVPDLSLTDNLENQMSSFGTVTINIALSGLNELGSYEEVIKHLSSKGTNANQPELKRALSLRMTR